MIRKYSLLAFIILSSHNLLYVEAYGAPIAYTQSNPLTPLDPHLSNYLEPLYKTNNIHQQPRQSRSANGVSLNVLNTYKRNLDEAMGKRTSTMPKSVTSNTSIVTTTTTTTTTNDKVKKTSTDQTQKKATSKDIKRTEASSQTTTTSDTNTKNEDKKIISTNVEKYKKENKALEPVDKKAAKEDQKTVEKANANKEGTTTLYEQKDFKKEARKQAYDGARPQLWYGGPWKRG
ncbi:MAG: hypothetical protein Q8S31_01075 [Alphaproteobacteria bacterium]|nr:hypothetical protein [Alphaproteobacteria bacterium]